MMKSHKTLLEEFFQKNGEQRGPSYMVRRNGGPSHCPIWECELTLPCGKVYTSKGRSKKIAKSAAAEQAANVLFNCVEKPTPISERVRLSQLLAAGRDYKASVLIDMENVHCKNYVFPKDMLCVGCVSHSHPTHLDKTFPENCAVEIVNSTRRDAADHFITYLCSKIIEVHNIRIPMFIVSRDKFAECLADIARQFGVKATVIKDFESMKAALSAKSV